MEHVSRAIPLVLMLLLLMTGLMVGAVCADAPKPPVPEFTVKLVAYPYDLPSIYGIDEYTGANITIHAGFRFENKTIEVSIKNVYYSYSYNGSSCWIVYNVKVKGHYGDSWQILYPQYGHYPGQGTYGYRVISLPADGYPEGGEIDFQVQSIAMYNARVTRYEYKGGFVTPYIEYADLTGESSDWSPTQTILMPKNSSAASPAPTLSPQNQTGSVIISSTKSDVLFGLSSEQIVIIFLGVAIVVLLAVVALLRRGRGVSTK